MGTVTFTARRSLVMGHADGETVSFDIGVSDDTSSRRAIEKVQQRSKGGGLETLYYRGDTEWTIHFQPVNGNDVLLLREFLDSTESGEQFSMQLFGTESTQLSLKRMDDGYTLAPFTRTGSSSGDWYQATPITAIET